MDTIMNKKSGMLGVSGISSDGRDISTYQENPCYFNSKRICKSCCRSCIGYYGLWVVLMRLFLPVVSR